MLSLLDLSIADLCSFSRAGSHCGHRREVPLVHTLLPGKQVSKTGQKNHGADGDSLRHRGLLYKYAMSGEVKSHSFNPLLVWGTGNDSSMENWALGRKADIYLNTPVGQVGHRSLFVPRLILDPCV